MKNLVNMAKANTSKAAKAQTRKENTEKRNNINQEVTAVKTARKTLNSVIRELKEGKHVYMLDMLGVKATDKKDVIRDAVLANVPIRYKAVALRRSTRYAVIDGAYVAGYIYTEIEDWLQAVKLAAENASIKHVTQVKLTDEDMEKFYYKYGEVMQDVPVGDVEFISREEYSEHMKK